MPDESQKRRWRVNTWSERPEVVQEATRIENALNTLADDNYEIYEVNYERQIAIGRHDAPVEMPRVASLSELLGGVLGRRPPPDSEPQEAQQAEDPPYTIQGALTARLLNGIHAVGMFQAFGDPTGDKRLDKMVQDLFSRAPRIEVERTIADIQVYHDRHATKECADPECQTHTLMTKAKQKLEAQLQERPLS